MPGRLSIPAVPIASDAMAVLATRVSSQFEMFKYLGPPSSRLLLMFSLTALLETLESFHHALLDAFNCSCLNVAHDRPLKRSRWAGAT